MRRPVFPSKFESRCAWCGDSTHVGQMITRRNVGWVHEECARASDECDRGELFANLPKNHRDYKPRQ